jgi:hypothetical protein
VLHIDRTVSAAVAAPTARCLEVLGAVEAYPDWAGPIVEAEVLERDSHSPDRVRLRAGVLGLTVEMHCTLELRPDGAVLRRLPYDPGDDERYEATWTLSDGSVTLHVVAAIDAPGAAGLLRGRVARHLADDLLADFVRAL